MRAFDGRSRWVWLFAAGVSASSPVACGGEPGEASQGELATGVLRVGLSTRLGALTYRLEARFVVDGPEHVELDTASFDADHVAIARELTSGSYEVTIEPTFRVFREAEGQLVPVIAELRSPVRQAVTITAGDTTALTYRFAVDDDVIAFGTGQLDIDFSVQPTELAPRRELSRVLEGAPWAINQATPGMAVDASERVYVADARAVYVVDGSSFDVYLTVDEASAAADLAPGASILDLDISPDGLLYILVSGAVVTSSARHQAELFRKTPELDSAQYLGVIGDGDLFLAGYTDGLWAVTATEQVLRYPLDAVGGGSGCAMRDLAVLPSGTFLYQPGCNASPLFRGDAGGSGAAILYAADGVETTPIHASNFECSARDPLGGFYVAVEDASGDGMHLYHVAEDAQGSVGLTAIATRPTFVQAAAGADEPLAFRYCSMAAASSGAVYLQTFSQLWKLSPP